MNELIEKLFDLYYQEAVLYIYTLSKDIQLSEDIVMESFYKAITGKCKDFDNFKFWLLKTSKNSLIDNIRKRKKISYIEIDNEIKDSCEDSILDRFIKEEKYKNLYRVIDLLPLKEKECINLFYFEKLPIKKIAELLQLNDGYVKVILMRARKKIKKMLKGDFDNE